jgi:hypothetical protein
MRVRWRELFTSKVNAELRWDRWDFVALAIALFIVIWVFALKLKTFYDLGYSSDLFVNVQLARSWLEGAVCSRTTVLGIISPVIPTFYSCRLDL